MTEDEVVAVRGKLEEVKSTLRQMLEAVSLQSGDGWEEREIRELDSLCKRISRESDERILDGGIIYNRLALNYLKYLADVCDLLNVHGCLATHPIRSMQRRLDWLEWQEGDR